MMYAKRRLPSGAEQWLQAVEPSSGSKQWSRAVAPTSSRGGLVMAYRGTSLITCGDSENACYFLTKTRNFPKNACLFLKELRNFPKNACLFLTQLRNFQKNACLFLKKFRNCSKNACFSKTHVQGYLAHKNPLPSHRATIGP